jgi:hypothetical protein
VPLALAIGIVSGAATSILQTHADQPWLGLVNSVSPWVTTAFVAGAVQRKVRLALFMGTAATVVQVLSYFVCSILRDFGVSNFYVLFWAGCAVIAGPLFGWAGHIWSIGQPQRFLLAATAALPAAWLAEGLVSYGWRLNYTSTAALFVTIGVVLAVALGQRTKDWLAQTVWLAALSSGGGLGFVVLASVL